MKGVLLAGTHSGCGKTTMALGLLAALQSMGLRVRGFKAGPDFIDAGLHGLVTGTPSGNLDLWMCGPKGVRDIFCREMENADFAMVEGAMGLFDGKTSSAGLAEFLGLPVLLIVDAFGQAESAAAVVMGFQEYARRHFSGLRIAGILFDRVGSPSHYQRLREAVSGTDVLGYLPRDTGFELPHRHLGLTVAEDAPISQIQLQSLGDSFRKHVDMPRLLDLCNPEIPVHRDRERSATLDSPIGSVPIGGLVLSDARPSTLPKEKTVRIAVAYDRAFCFYYRDNFALLREAGAELVFFSPLSDQALPLGVDALYLGGGYPELHAETLSGNVDLLEAIKVFSQKGGFVYAECGGLMYLSRRVHGLDGRIHPMCGVLPFDTAMKKERARLGYREIELKKNCFLGKEGWKARGHEFHYSEVRNQEGSLTMNYGIKDNRNQAWEDEGYGIANTLASYVHLHFRSRPEIPEQWIASILGREI
jgi:cobyrinic acid a,c-diamide synthase